MPKLERSSTQFLEKHGGRWRVTIAVPKALHGALGTRLKRPLHTDSLTEANRRKWAVIAELRSMIEAARGSSGGDALAYAKSLTNDLRRAVTSAERGRIDDLIAHEAEKIGGPPLGEEFDPDEGEVVTLYDPDRERRAVEFMTIARGKAVAVDAHHQLYMDQLNVKPRTRADDLRAIGYLKEWCRREGVPAHLSAMTPRTCVRFKDDIQGLAGGVSEVTANKYLRRLSRYWQWLQKRHEVPQNVWHGMTLDAPTTPHEEKERPFTADEMVRLLNGATTQHMHDLMRIGALTGARLDAIVCLRVKDCQDDNFTFKPQKKEPAPRLCPIHPALAGIVSRRIAGRSPEDPLFPEWPAPVVNSLRERSFKASNQFTDYRREVGVDDAVAGRRRALTNFHSFRRWFVTAAEQADQPVSIIAAVVGHKRDGITLSVYSSGPKIEQARRCVEAVELPEGCGEGILIPGRVPKTKRRKPTSHA